MTVEGKVWDGAQWRTGIRVWDAGSYYPSRSAGWIDLADRVVAPAVWTFDADNQGWTDNSGLANPAEWRAADGRIVGDLSGDPVSLFGAASQLFSPSIKLVGPGPFKLSGTIAADIVSGHVEANDTRSLSVYFRGGLGQSDGGVGGPPLDFMGGTPWLHVESSLWTPNTPDPTIQLTARLFLSTSLFPPYGDARARVHLNDITVLHADGSQAMREVTKAKVGKVWDGTRWVDFI